MAFWSAIIKRVWKWFMRANDELIRIDKPEKAVAGSEYVAASGIPTGQVRFYEKDTFVGNGMRIGDVLYAPGHVIEDSTFVKTPKTVFGVDGLVWKRVHNDVFGAKFTPEWWSYLGVPSPRVGSGDSFVACCDGELQSTGRTECYGDLNPMVKYYGSTRPGFSGAGYMNGNVCYGMHLGALGTDANGGIDAAYLEASQVRVPLAEDVSPEAKGKNKHRAQSAQRRHGGKYGFYEYSDDVPLSDSDLLDDPYEVVDNGRMYRKGQKWIFVHQAGRGDEDYSPWDMAYQRKQYRDIYGESARPACAADFRRELNQVYGESTTKTVTAVEEVALEQTAEDILGPTGKEMLKRQEVLNQQQVSVVADLQKQITEMQSFLAAARPDRQARPKGEPSPPGQGAKYAARQRRKLRKSLGLSTQEQLAMNQTPELQKLIATLNEKKCAASAAQTEAMKAKEQVLSCISASLKAAVDARKQLPPETRGPLGESGPSGGAVNTAPRPRRTSLPGPNLSASCVS
jgi:hypothetical protein